MKGWHIFTHSVRLVLNNLDAAFRVSLVLYCVTVAYHIAVFLNPPQMMDMPMGDGMGETMRLPMVNPGTAGLLGILGLLTVVAGLWIAVAWHRYVLLSEYPRGWLPRFDGGRMLGYLGRSLLIAILIGLAILVLMMPLGFLAIALPGLAALYPVLAVGVGSILFFRLGVILPAGAVDRKMTLGEAWDATKDGNSTVLVLAGLMMAGSLILQLPSMLNGDPGSIINLVYGIVVNWFATIIGVSVLTTLYGHFVEGRAID